MKRVVGTVVRGLRSPIIDQGDPLADIVVDTVINASEVEGYALRDRDVVTVTESVVARAQGNYASIDDIARDVKNKFGEQTIGLVFPILSRNRFSILLSGIAKGAKKIVLMLSYPSDEVGNHLVSLKKLDELQVNPWQDVLTEEEFRSHFGETRHVFTDVDYITYYRSLIEEQGAECEIIFANNAQAILDYTDTVIACDIHSRERTVDLLKEGGVKSVCSLADILNEPNSEHGYNETYGLLGSNKATDTSVKLFPRDCQAFVDKVQAQLKERTGKTIEVMVYGDGAFKDPVGQIWELADPVVSPGYTDGLDGVPNEVKLKYLADNDFADKSGEELTEAISAYLQDKDTNGNEGASLGTTPRRITDLIGSLSDLTSGSGDKGTPIIYIQGYFDSYIAD
ncbi:F420-0--gamma-glutamyl ligase [Suicoccus acidiformans]|uniref:F420-0--gamma-glutamyl ligase n=1 Tax=Suicoccus acidiformans TaxID=2036206 RepID=A0A347WL49_9LACT|nr:coenzyme F420-0:L-glutamate ligase [Suicoccus acidiformans]AXY25806.1 F420-0--gamma-glutamyl ligase [Suicoccus acidiformans]